MEEIILVKEPIKLEALKKIAKERGSNLVKVVVDVKENIIAIGGAMHADEEKFLIEQGSIQEDLWGINIHPDSLRENWVEFDSMINIRPRQNNRSRGVEDPDNQEKIIGIVNSLVRE